MGKDALKGGYILVDSVKEMPDIILMASGSEVEYIYESIKKFRDLGIDPRIVSMPSMDLFEMQSDEYKEKVLPLKIRKRIAIEAGSPFGWHRYVGLDGTVIAINNFGASAPAGVIFEKFGFTVDHVVEEALKLVNK